MESSDFTLLVIAIWLLREFQNHILVKDLMNRLMSKDYSQYNQIERQKSGKKPPKARGVALTDAEMAQKEIERMDEANREINEEIEERLKTARVEKVGVA